MPPFSCLAFDLTRQFLYHKAGGSTLFDDSSQTDTLRHANIFGKEASAAYIINLKDVTPMSGGPDVTPPLLLSFAGGNLPSFPWALPLLCSISTHDVRKSLSILRRTHTPLHLQCQQAIHNDCREGYPSL